MTCFTNMIPVNRLQERLGYDADTGLLTWKHDFLRFRKGDPAGTCAHGYCAITIDGCRMMAHRIAWAMTTGSWPENQIDHINGNRLDNRFCNLREATNLENCRNVGPKKISTTGVKGVYRKGPQARGKPFVAMVQIRGRVRYIGSFDTIEDARQARAAIVSPLHGEFFRE